MFHCDVIDLTEPIDNSTARLSFNFAYFLNESWLRFLPIDFFNFVHYSISLGITPFVYR